MLQVCVPTYVQDRTQMQNVQNLRFFAMALRKSQNLQI